MWRQGDVLIESVAALPGGLLPQKKLVLASSDSTGHAHRIRSRTGVKLYAQPSYFSSEQFLEITVASAEVVHPEHGTITLAKGLYRVWRQREFDDYGGQPIRD